MKFTKFGSYVVSAFCPLSAVSLWMHPKPQQK